MKNNIVKVAEVKYTCTSCQICSAVCPTDAIKIVLDSEGFYKPIVNDEKCISCGICIKSCYKYDQNIEMKNKNYGVYGAKSKDKNLLETSTSGGIATLLLTQLINKNYIVIGVTYDYKDNIAKALKVENIEDLEKIKGSKYIQSFNEEIYKETIKSIKNNEKVAIIGLPCQIYAFDRYSRNINKRENLFLIDLFCHGCPSINSWKKYLDYIERKDGIKYFDKVEFRSKKNGWHEFSLYFENKNKRKLTKNYFEYFYRLFFSDKILNKSCYFCELRSTLVYTDVRLGDFWGNRYQLDKEGVSAVACGTKLGNSFFKEIKDIKFEEVKLEEVIKEQSYGKRYNFNNEKRRILLDSLSSSDTIEETIKKLNSTLNYREKIKLLIKRCYFLFPQRVRFLVKKLIKKGV